MTTTLWVFMVADVMKRQQALVYLINSATPFQAETFVHALIGTAIISTNHTKMSASATKNNRIIE